MLTRSFRPIKNLVTLNSRCFSTPAYSQYSDRMSSLRSQYPGLFSSNFESEQEEILSNINSSNIDNLVNDYNSKRQEIYTSCGEDLFMTLDTDNIVNNRHSIVRSYSPSDDEAQTKLSIGANLMNELNSAYESNPQTEEERNLRMVRVSDIADEIQNWKLLLADPVDDNNQSVLPISDEELDDWVFTQFSRAPTYVRSPSPETATQEQEWMQSLDERAYDELLSSRGVDRNQWLEFCRTTNEMFHPQSIEHYGFKNQAKLLFRSALWSSEDTINSVSDSMKELQTLYHDSGDNDPAILRSCYELYPNTPYSGLAAFYLSITDPLFSARLVNEVRDRIVDETFERAVRDVTRDFELNIINQEIKEIEKKLQDEENTVLQRKIRELEEEANLFDSEPSSLDSILDNVLPLRLWGNDISNVKQCILNYASGSGSLSDINNAIESTLNPNTNENNQLDEDTILDIMIRYHNATRNDLSNMNLSDLLSVVTLIDQRRYSEDIIRNKRTVRRLLESRNVHPFVTNMVKELITTGQTALLPRIIEDYDSIVKIYRGELDGTITSAQELSSQDFEAIKNAIESQNTGKKITLETVVDPSLQSGFIVSIGVNKWNFSLSNIIDQGRAKMN